MDSIRVHTSDGLKETTIQDEVLGETKLEF